jgi:hypothetical protein
MAADVFVCRGCGHTAKHRRRSDAPEKFRTRCVECHAAYMKRWRRENWARRKAYDTWKGMISRCHDREGRRQWSNAPGVPQWRDYGGKGIKVCRRWRESFEAFLEDVGLPPTPEATLDRQRCRRGYSKSNARWVDPLTQASNRQNTRWTTARHPDSGEELTLSLSEWGRRTGIDRRTIGRRLDRGWIPDEAVGRPTKAAACEIQDVPF